MLLSGVDGVCKGVDSRFISIVCSEDLTRKGEEESCPPMNSGEDVEVPHIGFLGQSLAVAETVQRYSIL